MRVGKAHTKIYSGAGVPPTIILYSIFFIIYSFATIFVAFT